MYNEILLDNIHFGDRFPKKIQLFFFFFKGRGGRQSVNETTLARSW